jgi:uncharacterized protein
MFKVKNRRFVYDIGSCIFIEIDSLAWDVLERSFEVNSRRDIINRLRRRYSGNQISEAIYEMEEMESDGYLFTENTIDVYKERPTTVSTLCLTVAHDCNLNCQYCFSKHEVSEGSKKRMSSDIAHKAVDFLVRESGHRKTLTLCFFGGEPLLNFSVIKETVDYALQQEKLSDKKFLFNLTTNGTQMNRETREFLANHGFGVIFSIDGPKDIQDTMRPFNNGAGSYDIVSSNLRDMIEHFKTHGLDFSVRATYTKQNFDISRIAKHLVDLGCHDISVEPAVLQDDLLEISSEDLPKLRDTYTQFAMNYIDDIRNGRYFSFFHFRHGINQTSLAKRNFTQCGAGNGYLSISADGNIYPCHRLTGNNCFLMGSIFDGIKSRDINRLFGSAHVNRKKSCKQCWAKYICGGGCHAYAIEFNRDILEPYNVECELMKHRIELGAYIYAEIVDDYENIMKLYDASAGNRPYLNQ